MRQPNLKIRKLRCESLEDRRMLSATWVVNTANDYSSWTEDDSVLSLREAVSRAGEDDVITFSSDLSSTTFTIKFGELNVGTALTIDAAGWRTASGVNRVSLTANSRSRIFNVASGASLTLTALNLRNGYTAADGGAIYTAGTLELNNCAVSASSAEYGGGIYSFQGDVVINGGSVSSCTAKLNGGGMYIHYGTLQMNGCTVNLNTAKIGGGIDCSYSGTNIIDSVISGNKSNSSDYFAGGIHVHGGLMGIYNSRIVKNVSHNYGGGMYIHDASVWIYNSLIAENTATYTGAGIENFGWLELTHCTVTANQTSGEYSGGAGIYNYYGNSMYVKAYNCIISGNISASGKTTADFEGNGFAYGYNLMTTSEECWNHIENYFEYDSAYALFTDAEAGDYTLPQDSQAVDLGENSYRYYDDGSLIEYDLAGNGRLFGDFVDLGAYEYHLQQTLDAPTGVTAVSGGANRIRLTWDEVPESTGYTVAWSADQTSWSQSFSSGPSMLVTGLTYGTTCHFKVKALGDGETWESSEYSQTVASFVCPADVDGDGFIGPGDNSILSAAWFSSKGAANWDERCDIDGDGFIGPGDRSYLSVNWFKVPSQGQIVYPPALAAAVNSEEIFSSLDAELEEILANRF